MAIFAVQYVYADRPEELAARRPEHRAYLAALRDRGELLASGPLPAAGDLPEGALIVVVAPDLAGAEALLDAEPLAGSGLIAHRTIRPWTVVLGEWADPA